MSQKRKRTTPPPAPAAPEIFRSEPIEDRSSTFIGYFSPTIAPKNLQALPEIQSASHKTVAWRRQSNQQSIYAAAGTLYVKGCDDDGEKYGGKRIEKVLESMKVTGACVVARWYGGVMLGPVRFTHIEECAKGAIQDWGDSVAQEQDKRRKVQEAEAERARLVDVLGQRDESVAVLRSLAAEKEALAKESSETSKKSVNDASLTRAATGAGESVASARDQRRATETSSEAKVEAPIRAPPAPEYKNMPLERLAALEKARDATLSFLLKRIDKAEKTLEKGEIVEPG